MSINRDSNDVSLLINQNGAPVAVATQETASALTLHPVSPNPFVDRALVTFDLPRAAGTSLTIYDVAGRRLRTLESGTTAAGRHSASWDGRSEEGRLAAAGVYLVRLVADGEVRTQRVVLTR